MGKIERRRAGIKLQQGNYETELAELLNKAMAAQRAQETGGARFGTRGNAMELAAQYDEKLAEADETAELVTVWAISHAEWSHLADQHQPRADDETDKTRGVNMKTFPAALLRAALVDPTDVQDIADIPARVEAMLTKGGKILDGLDLSRVHYMKLETGAWNVNVGDDALPKFSLVSLLKQASDPDSKPSGEVE